MDYIPFETHLDRRIQLLARLKALGQTETWLWHMTYIPIERLRNFIFLTKEELDKIDHVLSDAESDLLFKMGLFYGKHMQWMDVLIKIQQMSEVVNVCTGDPALQKAAYEDLNNYIKETLRSNNGNLPELRFIVNDPAFGEMELFKNEEQENKDDNGTS